MYGSFIGFLCASFPLTANLQQAPCQKATEAYFNQVGLAKTYERAEAYASRVTTDMENQYLGLESQVAAGVIYTAAVKKSVSLSTRDLPLVHRTTVEGHSGGATLKFGWSF